VVPDLLGSGSACNATATNFPLFAVSDWVDQVQELMLSVEAADTSGGIDQWCVVANGGCSPIALQLAAQRRRKDASSSRVVPVSNLVLSSVPRLPFFLPTNNNNNETTTTTNDHQSKVAKSYRTLCGLPGKLFWWYSCRNNGAFIQKFSEKNLCANPATLGPTWRSNCYETAVSFGGKGKYATFSFLAGTLQDGGCRESLEAIRGGPVKIGVIKGMDVRRNQARSWFWQKPKKQKPKSIAEEDVVPEETFRDYVERNGNGGRELVVGGRISLAHEDPEGYADAILQFLFGS